MLTMAPGFARARRRSQDSRQASRKFYKIKEKDTSKPLKVLGILVSRDINEERSNYPNTSTSIPYSAVRHGGLQLSGHTIDKGYAPTEMENHDLRRQKEVSSSYRVSNICRNVNKAGYRVYHSVPVPIEQKPHST